MRTRLPVLLPWILSATALALMGTADAHVAPARDTNNRYLRITPMRDRVRLAYTVYIGELPGARARQRMDGDRDGLLSEDESRVYSRELAELIIRDLEITMDGAPYALTWSEQYVGLGTPVTSAGSFSVDLIGWICAEDSAGHRAVIFDRYQIPLSGETEVKIQESPGITIKRSSLGGDNDASLLKLQWRGNDGPMATRGLYLDYDVDLERAEIPPGSQCRPEPPQVTGAPGPAPRNWLAVLALLAVGAVALALFVRKRLAARGSSQSAS